MNRKIANSERLESVQAYLADNKSLREKAKELGFHYTTLFRWVKRYKNGGEESFYRFRISNNLISLKNEEAIVKLKEEKPVLTIHQAKQILNTQGIKISNNGIWRVWQKYGFCGFIKEKFGSDFRLYIAKNPKLVSRTRVALNYLKDGDNKKAAKVVNSLPYCPVNEVLEKIPDRLLNLRKRVEKLPLTSADRLSYSQFRKKAYILRCQAEERNLNYSALRVGIMELFASGWIGDPQYQLSLATHLEKLLNLTKHSRFNDLGILFTILIYKARAYAGLFRIKKAVEYAQQCKKILKNRRAPNLKRTLSTLFATLGLNRGAYELIKQARSECTEDNEKLSCDLLMSLYETKKGNYRAARDKLKESKAIQCLANVSSFSLVNAHCALGAGKLQEAQEFATMALNQSQKTGLRNNLHYSSLVLASVYMYLGEQKKAYSLLTRFNFLFQKYKMKKHLIYRFLLANHKENKSLSAELNFIPELHLITLLKKAAETQKITDYRRAYNYSKRNDIMGTLHQFIPFYAGSVINILKRGKPTQLPKTLTRLPVFNKEIPVYHIQYLGSFIVDENQRYLKIKLKPKDKAFLIYLCFKAMERNKSIKLDEIYKKFWPKSENPAGNFSHLLVRVKKVLKIPAHLLTISRKYGLSSLVNEGIYLTTDHQEFEQILAQAKALERAEEWGFAKREYLRAFKLFRGEPFRKMYDPWSEQMRRAILNRLETEAINFAKSCFEHKNKKDAKKVLEKILKIIPYSEEIKLFLKEL